MSSTAGAVNRAPLINELTNRQLVVFVAHTALALLLAIATILLLRRLGGGFIQPLGPTAIILAALFVECAAIWIRRLYQSPELCDSILRTQYSVVSTRYLKRSAMRVRLFFSVPHLVLVSPVGLATTAAVLAIAIALSIRGTSPASLVIAWFIIVGGEIIQRIPRSRSLPAGSSPQQPSLDQMPAAEVSTDELSEPEIPPGLVQQLTRVVEDGRESIHGLLKADIAANDRLAIVHIAFCPPLGERPELAANAVDCDDVEIRITQVESFGARLEARLPAMSESPRSLMIEILGSSTANQCS
jgi:hypothetical protein